MPNIFERILNLIRGKNDSPLAELHPELQSRVPIMRVFSDEILSYSQLFYDIGVRDYGRHPWVHKAIKVLSDNIASLKLEVIRVEGEEKEALPNHPLNEILMRPNPAMAPADLWRQWVIDMMLGGEEGHEIVRNAAGSRILEIWPREPTIFSVIPGTGGRRYANVLGYKIDDKQGPEYNLQPNQFIHFKFYNPANPWRGIAPINAVRMSITIDQLAQAWSRLFFKNQARPDFAVVAPEGLTHSEKIEIENRLQKEFGDPEGWHKPIVLEEGVTDVKTLSFPPKDLTWLEQRKFSRDETGAIFGVPDEILGYGRDTYENFGTAMRVLWTLTLVPLIDFRDTVFTSWARRHKILKPDERIQTNLTGVPELQENKGEKVEQYAKLVGHGVPLNLANRAVGLDLPPLEGGDVGFLPISYVPVTSVDQRSVQRSLGSATKSIPEYGSEKHQEIMKRNEARIAPLKDKMKRDLKKFWQRQQNEVSRRLRSSRSFGRGKFVKQDEIPPPVSELFDLEAEIEQFMALFGPTIYGAIETVGRDEILALGLELEFDMTRPEVQAAYQGILQAQARRTQDRIWLDLISLFEEAEAAGESLPEIVERLSAFYGDLKSEYQVERIARTTMTGASNAGAVEAWDQSEVVSGRGWISALIAGRTREAHEQAHGQIVGLREAFLVGGEFLMYPGDPNGSPGNIINCFPEETSVISPSSIQKATRRYYEDMLIELETASGIKLSGTPNHPVLTDKGWIPLHALVKGDNLVGCHFAEKMSFGNPDIYCRPASIGEIFSALEISGGSQSVLGADSDFHGDGMNGYIDIVSTNSLLKNGIEATLLEPSGQYLFSFPNFTLGSLSGNSLLSKFFLGRSFSSTFTKSMGGDFSSSFWAELRKSKAYGIPHATKLDTSIYKDAINGASRDTKFLSDLFLRFSRYVFLDNIVSIRGYEFSGHVYNLQTKSNWYISNGIITHNCLCATYPIVGE